MTEEEKVTPMPSANEPQQTKQDQPMLELDGKVETAAPHSAEHHEKKLSPRELKQKRELEHKARLKAEKEQLKKMQKEQNPGQNNDKKKKMIVVLAVFAILAGSFSLVYFKFPHLLHKSHTPEETAMTENPLVVDTVFEDSIVNSDIIPETEEETAKNNTKTTKTSESPQVKSKKEAPTTSKKGKLTTPCWIISYASISSEDKASREVKKLADNGYISGYYWIPDYDANGKKLFKVYVGPFASQSEGKNKLQDIQASSPTAYLMKLE